MHYFSYILVIYGVTINLVTFFLFAWDKYRAKTHGRRISEKSLLGFMIFGGFLGALAGQSYFRHKTVKSSFVWRFRVIIFFWFFLLIFLLYSLQ